MDRAELLERLKGYEWNDIEFKEATWAVPNSAYETVSAFANTAGGWLVFGVAQKGQGKLEIVGVIEVDKLQNDFLGMLRDPRKFNRIVECNESLFREEEKALLVFHIPEASRQGKPVYLDGDIRKTYIRLGGRDQTCSSAEIERFLRDASAERYDGETVNLDPEKCFDVQAIEWYRAVFSNRNPPHETQILSNLEFLQHWGLIIEQDKRLRPTRASIILFGTTSALLQILPRPIVDCQWHNTAADDAMFDERWSDRFLSETNLVHTWRELLSFYQRHTATPFSIEADTLQRTSQPPDYIAFREATINLLMHQDYGDHSRKAGIDFFRDKTIFLNPGNAFDYSEKLLESGEREVRNPRIVAAFRRIGLSEQAGTGIRSIFRNWSELGNVPPVIDNDKAQKSFQLALSKEPLLSDEQLLFQASIGVTLSDDEAATFAMATRKPQVNLLEVQALGQLSGSNAQAVLDRLVTQALLEPIEGTSRRIYRVAERFRDRIGPVDQTGVSPEQSEQPANGTLQQLTMLTSTQWKIVAFCDVSRTAAQIRDHLGLSRYKFDKGNYLEPMVEGGILDVENPDNPRKRRYELTEAGLRLMLHRHNREIEADQRSDK